MFRELRRPEKKLDKNTVDQILMQADEGYLGTISVDTGHPHVVCVNHYYDGECIYFHCAKEGHKIDNILNNDKVSFFVSADVRIEPMKLTTRYNSVELFGRASIVQDVQLKEKVLYELTKKYVGSLISKFASKISNSMNKTAIVKIEIEHLVGKTNYKTDK